MSTYGLVTPTNISRVLNRKYTVLSLYPELSRLYSNTQHCKKCKTNRTGSAILLHILNDPNLASKDKRALRQILPASFVNKLGE